MLKEIKLLLLFFLLMFIAVKSIHAQIIINEEPKRLYYERTMRVKKFKDMKDFRDVFHVNKFLLGKNRISGNISFNTGRVLLDDGTKLHKEFRSAMGYYLRYRFFEEFAVSATFFQNFNPNANARWIASFTYSIGRYNWRNKKFNYGYENYVNNRYNDNFKTIASKFLEGHYFLSYNVGLSDKLNKKIRLDSTSSIRFVFFSRYAFRYRDEKERTYGGFFNGKSTFGLSARYTIYRSIYIESAIYLYPEYKRKQQPWDPDYSYGFGFFDWRSFRVSLTYGNWAINHFPWRKSAYDKYGFIDGNFRVVVNFIW